jgi:ATP-dependent DNA helicase RecQ
MMIPPDQSDELALQILQTQFGLQEFRKPQDRIIQHALSGQHAMVIMPTGMGKSLCYQIPALVHRQLQSNSKVLTLVISPLIALMKDQVDGLRRKGIDASFINSSLKKKEREDRYRKVGEGRFDLLYVTPERFRKSEFLEVLAQREIALLAVDEAHCISEWGHDFRPDYTRLTEFRQILGNPTTLALTATATPDVQSDIVRQLGLRDEEIELFHEGIARPNLQLKVVEVWGDDEKLDEILQTMDFVEAEGGSGIVYFTLIKSLEAFSEQLRERKREHFIYHGELDRQQRRRLQNDFMENDSIVLATNAFGMGIDKEDIRAVVHAEVPGSMESYYQEIGRAGRDGRPAVCTLLYDERDLNTQMEFIGWSNPNREFYERVDHILEHESERLSAFGLEWFREKLHFKNKRDHRLDTALAMLERYHTIEGQVDPWTIRRLAPLPEPLRDEERLAEKLRNDQQKLYSLVQYAKTEQDRKAFIHEYFGLPAPGEDEIHE